MQRLLEIVKDPIWWFSAFFVAMLASVLAAFIKDWLSQLFAATSLKFRKFRIKKLRESVRVIQDMERDGAYMILSGIRRLSLIMLWIFLGLGYMLTIQLQQTQHVNIWISLFSRLVTLIFQMLVLYSLITSSIEFDRGLTRYKRKRGLHVDKQKSRK